jgi:hypothetical protein
MYQTLGNHSNFCCGTSTDYVQHACFDLITFFPNKKKLSTELILVYKKIKAIELCKLMFENLLLFIH